MQSRALSVSQLNDYVAGMMAHDPVLCAVKLRGEISNFRRTASGHVYFSMKDEFSVISCVMFRADFARVDFAPSDGAMVLAFGRIGLYPKEGQYQFYVQQMQSEGVGDLFAEFLRRKAELEQLGWFDSDTKLEIPLLPRRVGVVTSPGGAVIHDICRVIWRRYPNMPILLCPAKVQGDGASAEIARGIAFLDAIDDVDVIIVGRGGGSLEDLWAFNEPDVVSAVHEATTPIISAVGHETDFSLCDFAADMRAPTPSAAAELAVRVKNELEFSVSLLKSRLSRAMTQSLSQQKLLQQNLLQRLSFSHPKTKLQFFYQQLDILVEKLLKNRYDNKGAAQLIAHRQDKLIASYKAALKKQEGALLNLSARLLAVNPQNVLKRGYAMVYSDKGVVTSSKALFEGQAVKIALYDGAVGAVIKNDMVGE